MLYPLKFKTIHVHTAWEGSHLNNNAITENSTSPIGEQWLISGVQDSISTISEGTLEDNTLQELVEVYMGDLVGDKVYEKFGIEFPLLVKLLDIGQEMDLQVHPDDETALERHNAYGRTKMWYVLDAAPDAEITLGFKNNSTRLEYLYNKNKGTLSQILNKIPVSKGECFFIPAGTIFSAKGCYIAEIQQTSDITYYIENELDTELATDVINFDKQNLLITYDTKENNSTKLIDCKYFTANYLRFNKEIEKEYINIDSFVIYLCTTGEFELKFDLNQSISVTAGECILIPAYLKDILLEPKKESSLIEVYIS